MPKAVTLSNPIISDELVKSFPLQNFTLSLKNFSLYSVGLIYPSQVLLVSPQTTVEYTYKEIVLTLLVGLFFVWLFMNYWGKKEYIPLAGLIFFFVSLFPLCGLIYAPIFYYSNFMLYWLSVPALGLLVCLSCSKNKNMKYILSLMILVLVFKTVSVANSTPEPVSMVNASIEKSPKNHLIKGILTAHYEFIGQYEKANKILINIKKLSPLEPPDVIKYDDRIEKNKKRLQGEKIDNYTL